MISWIRYDQKMFDLISFKERSSCGILESVYSLLLYCYTSFQNYSRLYKLLLLKNKPRERIYNSRSFEMRLGSVTMLTTTVFVSCCRFRLW